MKRYSIFHLPGMSFYSKQLYVDVGQNWKGVNFLYLLLLVAVCLIPTMIIIHQGFSEFVRDEAPAIVDQVPEITITNGEVSIQEFQPYYIYDPDSNEPLAVIDITETISSLKDSNTFCLLKRSEIMWKKSKYETQIIDLSQIKHFVLTSERITGWLNIASKFLAAALYPFILLSSYAFRIVQALIFAVIGLLFASLCKVRLSYAALLRLAVVAMTPCLLVRTVFGAAGVYPPYVTLISLMITLGYLFVAVKVNAEAILIQEDDDPDDEEI